jgi:hypothetical protein
MKEYKDNLVVEFYSNLTSDLLNLSHIFFERKYAKNDNLNLKIHNYIYDIIKSLGINSLDKYKLYSHIYPNQEFNESKLNTALNRHIPDLKEFAILSEIKNENDYVEIIWTDFLVDYNMKRNLKYNIKRKDNEEQKKFIQPLVAYFNSREEYFYNIKFNEIIKTFESGELLKKYINNFESYTAYTKMQLYIGLVVQYMHLKEIQSVEKLKIELGDILTEYFTNINFHISSNAQILHLYLNFNENLFEILFDNILENIHKLPNDNKIFYLNNLFNFIIMQFRNGLEYMKVKEYELYVKLEGLNLLDIQGSITYRKLINIIYACLYNTDLIQAQYFLEKYYIKLPFEIRASCYSFNYARILFTKAEYQNALLELNNVNFSNSIIHTIISKKIEIQALISMGQYDVALNKLNAFSKFIIENKKIGNSVQLKCFSKLCRILIKPLSSKSIKQALKEIENNDNFDKLEREWVIRVLNL